MTGLMRWVHFVLFLHHQVALAKSRVNLERCDAMVACSIMVYIKTMRRQCSVMVLHFNSVRPANVAWYNVNVVLN